MDRTSRLPIVLASKSPRRRDLLALTGFLFNVRVVGVDETLHPDESPEDYVGRMARAKAAAVVPTQKSGLAVIAADTIVLDGDQVLGKPADLMEAEQMLQQLRGREHTVITAVAVQPLGSGEIEVEVCRAEVPMRNYSEDELARYLMSGDSLDKAGAYGIQNKSFHPVENLHGCFANVMGLPLCHLTRLLRKMGLESPEDVPTACQEFTEYTCPVYQQILDGEL